ncbi:MAG: hypothetical protein NTV51_06920 [Verrucomicrobia bacterium]|nr:hypothetical protein [Verrucomicrobiota bacterium]
MTTSTETPPASLSAWFQKQPYAQALKAGFYLCGAIACTVEFVATLIRGRMPWEVTEGMTDAEAAWWGNDGYVIWLTGLGVVTLVGNLLLVRSLRQIRKKDQGA